MQSKAKADIKFYQKKKRFGGTVLEVATHRSSPRLHITCGGMGFPLGKATKRLNVRNIKAGYSRGHIQTAENLTTILGAEAYLLESRR